MIELKNITKTYQSKKSLPTEALKGINLKLDEKGLTFILGKSGSGKSTLLNIIGGLDTYTSGELIVCGKSTKTFKEQDWDAYRNTYTGFIFQEFNLLDNYNIEDNIKLSLELQNQKVSSKDIHKILEQVDLPGIEKRKTNELSGGQKQRIAIARALIKNPSIILADEPTGNLDSTTSEQIFTLLKKLSKDKLIIVVSHDEASALKYGDRIIKISDGLITDDSKECKGTNKKEFQLVKAHLPFIYSIKMALNNLFKKKIKLIFSIISLVICFICLGVAISVKNSDFTKELLNRFADEGPTEVQIYQYSKKVNWKDTITTLMTRYQDAIVTDDVLPSSIPMSENMIEEAKNKTSLDWSPCYNIYQNGYPALGNEIDTNSIPYYYTQNTVLFSTFEYLPSSDLIGTTDPNGIVLTSFLADYIIYNGIQAKNDLAPETPEYFYRPTSYESIINDKVYIKIANFEYIDVTGILKIDTSKYEKLKNYSTDDIYDFTFSSDEEGVEITILRNEITNNHHLYRSFISKEKLNQYKAKENNTILTFSDVFMYKDKDSNEKYLTENGNFQFGFLKTTSTIYNSTTTLTLNDVPKDEIIINTYVLDEMTEYDYTKELNSYIVNNPGAKEEDFINSYLTKKNIIGKKITSNIVDNKSYAAFKHYKEYTISGVILNDNTIKTVYLAKDHVNKIVKDTVSLIHIYRYVDNEKELLSILKHYPLDDSDQLSSSIYTYDIEDCALSVYTFSSLSKGGVIIFGIIGLIFLTNFIYTSITLRKKEIGIFRALGCSSKDVIKIFIYECLSLLLICITISSIVLPKACKSMNAFLKRFGSTNYNPSIFDINCIFYMLLFGIVIASIISVISLLKLVKQKPIDTILDK